MTIPPVELTDLTFEHYRSPLGVQYASPRLSWRFASPAKDWVQRGYEVRVARGASAETYAVDSRESVLVPWPAAPLASREAATVGVRSYGSDGRWTAWIEGTVEAGLLERADWVAAVASNSDEPHTGAKRAAAGDEGRTFTGDLGVEERALRPFRVRKVVHLDAAPTRARLYITALGLHTTYVNGERLPDLLEPGWTSYERNLNYRVYDVTGLLRAGENVLGSWVGEGWYAGRIGLRGLLRRVWGSAAGLIAQLEVDGEVVAATDESWSWSYGAVTAGEIYDGESYDAGVEDEAWKHGVEVAGDWAPVVVRPLPEAELRASEIPPVRAYATLPVKEVITTPSGKTVLDFGQNFAGFVRVLSSPAEASTITLRHAEVLEAGELGVRPLRNCAQTDTLVVPQGGSVAGWTPLFTYHGFRYVEVGGWAGVTAADVEGVAISSDYEVTGAFECSHALLNRLHENVVWSTRSNTVSLPTDCPQRDERLGWTGDIQVFAPTFSFLFGAAGFLRNWLRDVRADQRGGVVPVTVPNVHAIRLSHMPHAVWGDVAALLPNDLYDWFGDSDIVQESLGSAIAWLDAIPRDKATQLWDRKTFQFGDWLDPAAPPALPWKGRTDTHLVADAYLIHTTRVVAKLAGVAGKSDVAARYEAQAAALLDTFHSQYLTPASRVVSDTQTAIALLLHFDLVDSRVPGQREVLARRLKELVVADAWQVSTGFAGTPIILQALAANGHLDQAYRMLLNRTSPSWLAPVLLGATTIWERWDSMLQDGSINPGQMTSFNHYALGSVAAFLHAVVGGLSPLEPGWRRVRISPQPGGNLMHAAASFVSPYGVVRCSWAIEAGKLHVTAQVPPNATALVQLPGLESEVGSGTHSFEVGWEEGAWPPRFDAPAIFQAPEDDWVRN
ncbi:hypothetical protein Q8F55_006041 [Vanrija albida]|uniref:alpha-L-rhamnosidase n=1 Tax=Vanrija albida TaxID=181172 RepID=A0ABR3Q383_9TREE